MPLIPQRMQLQACCSYCSVCALDAAHLLSPIPSGQLPACVLPASASSHATLTCPLPPRPLSPNLAGPFCHRSLLTLEEKRVPYSTTLIDFADKPQWLLDVNPAGSVPVMKVRQGGGD